MKRTISMGCARRCLSIIKGKELHPLASIRMEHNRGQSKLSVYTVYNLLTIDLVAGLFDCYRNGVYVNRVGNVKNLVHHELAKEGIKLHSNMKSWLNTQPDYNPLGGSANFNSSRTPDESHSNIPGPTRSKDVEPTS